MARLTVDSFPRSANHFAAASAFLCFPGSEIDWGFHRIESLRTSENVLTVVREPLEAVSSWMVYANHKPSADRVLEWYLRWMSSTIDNFNRIFAVSFDKFTSNPYEDLVEYSNRFKIDPPVFATSSDVISSMSSDDTEYLPRKVGEDREVARSRVLESKLFETASAAYGDVLTLITKGYRG